VFILIFPKVRLREYFFSHLLNIGDMKEVEISNTQSDAVVPIQHFMQSGGNKKFIIKHGSLQKFVEGAEEASDYGAKVFPDDQVRKIALLDIRILNCDRNEGNILVRK